jgi:hypothetical protein
MLCGVNVYGQGTYTAEGITKLCEALKESALTSLECAPASKCLLLCQRPLTLLSPALSPFPLHSWQFGRQPALWRRPGWVRRVHRRGHQQALRGAQGKRRDLAQVRRCPQAFAIVSAPADTPDVSPSPSRSSLAVWAETTSPTTAKTCQACSSSWKSSHRRRSKASGAPPPPKRSLLCQRPLTRKRTLLITDRSRSIPCLQSRWQQHWS